MVSKLISVEKDNQNTSLYRFNTSSDGSTVVLLGTERVSVR